MAKKMETLNLLQFIFEIAVAFGFLFGLIPFVYYITGLMWVIPLTVVNLVFSIIQKNGTKSFTITNVVMAFLALIPLIGIIPKIVGLIMSIMSAVRLGKMFPK
jgi:hypothetical protein